MEDLRTSRQIILRVIMFSFEYFKLLLMKAYQDVADNDSMKYEDVEEIFHYYFTAYEKAFKHPHKNIRLETIKNIIGKLPFCEHSGEYNHKFDLEVDDYKELIDKHFKTQYDNCDYSISHFMSGDIRANRLYETMY